jgi:hypothetical protein
MEWYILQGWRILLKDLAISPELLVLLLAGDQSITLLGVLDLEGAGLLRRSQGLFRGLDGGHFRDGTAEGLVVL